MFEYNVSKLGFLPVLAPLGSCYFHALDVINMVMSLLASGWWVSKHLAKPVFNLAHIEWWGEPLEIALSQHGQMQLLSIVYLCEYINMNTTSWYRVADGNMRHLSSL